MAQNAILTEIAFCDIIMTTIQNIDEILKHGPAARWYKALNGFKVEVDGGSALYEVPNALLEQCPPGTAVAIRALIEHVSKANDFDYAYQSHVQATMAQVAGDIIVLTDRDRVQHRLERIISISESENHPNGLQLMTMVVTTQKEVWDGKLVTFVTDKTVTNLEMTTAELDASYPGWRERWVMGAELGLLKGELMRLVFQHNTQSTASLPDISFDSP